MPTILLLAANPKGTERLRLDRMFKRIKQAVDRAKKRQFKLVVKWAVTDDDVRRALLDNEPEVVHFAGHGTGDAQGGTGRDLIPAGEVDAGGLVFEDDVGDFQRITGDALAGLFELCSDSVKCVVLNGCYSEAEANAITQHIEFVVGTNRAIGDQAAIEFAGGFYDALGAGLDFETAFNFGCNAINLKRIPEHLTPILKKNVSAVTLNTPSAAIERSDGPGEDVRRGIRDRIERRLKRLKPEVLRDLAEELLEMDESVLEERDPPIPNLLEVLLKPGSFSTIAGLAAIDDRLREDSDSEQAKILADIIEEVTPLVIDDGLAVQLWNEIHHRKSAFFYVPDRHSTTIEVLMARADGKGMKFKVPNDKATVDDYEGTSLLQPMVKSPVGAPQTVESVARSILMDLCEGQSVRDSGAQSSTLDELVQRLAGVLIDHSRGVNKKRTLYCLHKMPTRPEEKSVHERALKLVRDELDKLKRGGSKEWENFPGFVFLLLAENSQWEGLRSIIVTMLKRRLKHAR